MLQKVLLKCAQEKEINQKRKWIWLYNVQCTCITQHTQHVVYSFISKTLEIFRCLESNPIYFISLFIQMEIYVNLNINLVTVLSKAIFIDTFLLSNTFSLFILLECSGFSEDGGLFSISPALLFVNVMHTNKVFGNPIRHVMYVMRQKEILIW